MKKLQILYSITLVKPQRRKKARPGKALPSLPGAAILEGILSRWLLLPRGLSQVPHFQALLPGVLGGIGGAGPLLQQVAHAVGAVVHQVAVALEQAAPVVLLAGVHQPGVPPGLPVPAQPLPGGPQRLLRVLPAAGADRHLLYRPVRQGAGPGSAEPGSGPLEAAASGSKYPLK